MSYTLRIYDQSGYWRATTKVVGDTPRAGDIVSVDIVEKSGVTGFRVMVERAEHTLVMDDEAKQLAPGATHMLSEITVTAKMFP